MVVCHIDSQCDSQPFLAIMNNVQMNKRKATKTMRSNVDMLVVHLQVQVNNLLVLISIYCQDNYEKVEKGGKCQCDTLKIDYIKVNNSTFLNLCSHKIAPVPGSTVQ